MTDGIYHILPNAIVNVITIIMNIERIFGNHLRFYSKNWEIRFINEIPISVFSGKEEERFHSVCLPMCVFRSLCEDLIS